MNEMPQPSRWNSLRLRMLVGTLAWILVSVVVAGWGLGGLFQQHIGRQLHAELKTHLDQLTAAIVVGDTGDVLAPTPLSDPRFGKPFSGLYWQVDRLPGANDPPAAGVLRSRSLWDTVLRTEAPAVLDGADHTRSMPGPDGQMLSVVERAIQPDITTAPPWRLMVAADQRLVAEPSDRFFRMLISALTILSLGLMTAAIVQVIITMKPMEQLRRQLGALRVGKASRIEGRFPAEVQPLVDDFNGVLAANADIVARARTQAGNLAHAVKTPLTILANAAEQEKTAFAQLASEQVAMALRQVDYHLARARAAAALQTSGLRTPLPRPLEGLLRVMERLYADRGLRIDVVSNSDTLVFRGEEQDLQEMLGNLLDNACKWAKSRVQVSACQKAKDLYITIDDDGKGLNASEYGAIFARGARADEHAPGSGLGLAIVRDLAILYGGDVHAEPSALGGLRIALRLPAA
ncbi:MAG TPA: sensor histidine kinase [Candidimonas sp.]|nr:sensor histidine kinase [Candidimonas sp.]